MSNEKISKIGESKVAERCPYCQSKNFVKRGTRRNQYLNTQGNPV